MRNYKKSYLNIYYKNYYLLWQLQLNLELVELPYNMKDIHVLFKHLPVLEK